MNYYQPLQRLDDQRWDYCCHNKRTGTHAVGYCAGLPRPLSPEERVRFGGLLAEELERDRERAMQFAARYHTDGHATPEEARECYRRYVLDQKTQLRRYTITDAAFTCEAPGCTALTGLVAQVDHREFVLCEGHQTLEVLEQLVPTMGDAISSW